jgi:hypothetical protein
MAQKMMANRTSDQIEFARNHDTIDHDGIDRRGFLKCMAWAGTGALYVIQGGVLKSYSLSNPFDMKRRARGELSFIQISDSQMWFNKPANPDVVATLKAAVDKINGLPLVPEFMLHTGDISHLSKAEEFDNVDQAVYREWGWGTADSAQALSYLKTIDPGGGSVRQPDYRHGVGACRDGVWNSGVAMATGRAKARGHLAAAPSSWGRCRLCLSV